MRQNINDLAKAVSAYVESDGPGFRRAARVLQSIWREEQGLPIGEQNGRALGSRLPEEMAEGTFANYLTPGIRGVVRETMSSADRSQLFAVPRMYNDLLSSQSLCFNLFGELSLDFDLAAKVFQTLLPGMVAKVNRIRFEYSPGRTDQWFSRDRSAFDVFVETVTPRGTRGFVGLAVKYHENMQGRTVKANGVHDAVAARMACFIPYCLPRLRQAPLQQLWRNHLLAGSMICGGEPRFDEGLFAMLYPTDNPYCRTAVQRYRACLRDTATFNAWTLEQFVEALRSSTSAPWVNAFYRRYLDFDRFE